MILTKEEASVCVTCDTEIANKRIVIERADLVDVRRKYFEERSLYSLFRNIVPKAISDFLREIGVCYEM